MLSPIQTSGRFPGLNLRAWVVFTGAGALVSSSNVSGINRTGSGQTTVTFSTALPNANYVADYQLSNAAWNQAFLWLASRTTASCLVNTAANGAITDLDLVYVGFYA